MIYKYYIKRLLLLLVILLFVYRISCDARSHLRPKYAIGSVGEGFFIDFLVVINNLIWCEKNNRALVVSWDKRSLYFCPNGFNGSKNVWEYYFYPLNNFGYKPIVISALDPDGKFLPLMQNYITFNKDHEDTKNLIPIHINIINKFVKIKKNIRDKIDKFYNEKIAGKKTIGIHLRGTDKKKEVIPTDPLMIIEEANKFTGYQYFVATDEVRLLELAKKHLKGDVIFYDSYRSIDESPIHFNSSIYRHLAGEEVLIEAQLLSKCFCFLHTLSNVANACYYFNPYLKGILLRGKDKVYIN